MVYGIPYAPKNSKKNTETAGNLSWTGFVKLQENG